MGTIGVVLPPDLPTEEVIPYVRDVEAVGFDDLWVVEDCFARGGIAQAAVALASTDRLHVGLGILPAAARNTAFAAMEIATLAGLFPGRLTVGVGHGMPGWIRQVGAWPSSPVTLLKEHIAALRALLNGDSVSSLANRYVRLTDVKLGVPPASVPYVYAGVRGKVSLRASGQVADGTILAEPVTPEYLESVRSRLVAARPGHRIVAYNIASIDDDPVIARNAARAALAWIGEPEWAPHIEPLEFAGEFRALRASVGTREAFAQSLPDAWVDRLAVVGCPDRARSQLADLTAAGAHSNVLIPTAGRSSLPKLAELLHGKSKPRSG